MRFRSGRDGRALVARLTISLIVIGLSGTSPLARAGAAASSTNWLMYNGDYSSQRYAALDAINKDNVASLHKVCSFELGTAGTLQSGPVVSGGTVYVTTQRDTVALDASTCRLQWRSTYKPSETEVWNTNRGVAIADGKLYRGTQDAHLIALDATTGKQLWNIKAGDPKTGLFLSASPIVWNGLVYIGTAGADWGQKARMMAFSTTDGHRVWNFDLIPTGGEAGAQTWGKASTASTGGGSTWTSYSLDTKAGLIYVPVGNPAPDFSGDYRPGANLYTDSLVVLDAKTGALKWYYQLIPHDVHDYDLAAPPALVDTPAGKELAVIAGKDCTLRALDRATGKLVYQSAVCQRSNTNVPPTPNGTRVCPGWIGGVEWNGPAYDSATSPERSSWAAPSCKTRHRRAGVRSPPSTPTRARSSGNTTRSRRWWPR
jgi:glucose dehydrogenase